MLRRIFVVLVALVLLGCTALKPPPQNGFSATGRVSIRSAGDSHYANFDWQSAPALDRIAFNNPLGQTLAELEIHYREQTPEYAVLTDADGKSRVGEPEQLLFDTTGMQLPVYGLRWWLQGLPAPGGAVSNKTEDGLQIEQDGWRIVVSEFSETVPARRGPRKIALSRGEISVRIVISEWQWQQTSLQP